MRRELAFFVLVLSPALSAPKGCYYGSDLVPLGYNATGGFAEAGGWSSEDAGEPGTAGGSSEPGGGACNGGVTSAGGVNADAGNDSAGGASAGSGGAGHGGTPVIVLRPH